MLRIRVVSIAVAVLSTLALTTKIEATSYTRPINEEIVVAAGDVLQKTGFEVAGTITFAGRPAVMAASGACLIYVTPVSEQGWHEEAVRKALSPGQSISFVFKGENFGSNQPRWAPLFDFYFGSIANHFGWHRLFEPVYAVVKDDHCSPVKADWRSLPGLNYRLGSALDTVVDDH